MSDITAIERRFVHWSDRDLPSIRAGLAEAVVAELAEESGDDARWYGGGTAALDVTNVEDGKLVRRNAKSVRREKYRGVVHVALARRNAQPFDAEKLDRVVLVLLAEASSGFDVDLERGIASVEGHASLDRVWDVSVPELNDLMPDHDPETEGNIRNVLFTFEQLAPYQVWPRDRAARAATAE
ncbi:hypothetical protein [Leifsonia shinshuensis]|uniref:Uncharacterized protein n=1 Tax=Leifsonia shinshuensis TaxID=150026 RepID=A0A853CR36_9MICO|nr:hypothetical protein [Leifsonia shinshuensis]NYJ22769.1 hypothetical protein [Leifsonia shinshuensis]